MRERDVLIGGQFDVRSAIRRGTEVSSGCPAATPTMRLGTRHWWNACRRKRSLAENADRQAIGT